MFPWLESVNLYSSGSPVWSNAIFVSLERRTAALWGRVVAHEVSVNTGAVDVLVCLVRVKSVLILVVVVCV